MKPHPLKVAALLFLVLIFSRQSYSQQVVGAITGTVTDPTGAAVPDATVKAFNAATNLEITAQTKSNGSYVVAELPAGTYKLTITKDGFKTETHTEVLVNGNRTTTVDAALTVGMITAQVEVTAVPLMNQVDTTSGYVVDHVVTGEEALSRGTPDVVLLDLGLPDTDGVHVCRELRQRSKAAIIVITAFGEESDRVTALDAGADDYLVKPFGVSELLARIRAVLRRVQPDGDTVRHGPLAVDLRTRRVSVAGQEVTLTPKEFDILECLASDPGRVQSRQDILEAAWDANWYGPTKVLDVHVAALRRKLGVPGLIETVYGRGFRLGDA